MPTWFIYRRPNWAATLIAVRRIVISAFPGFGPKSRDVGGAEARRGVGPTAIVRIATELSRRSASCSGRR